MIMTRIITDRQIAPLVDKHGISFLVESGNNNNSEIEQFFQRMSKQPAFGGALRSISFVAKNSCRAIQLADFFAFYGRRHMRNAELLWATLFTAHCVSANHSRARPSLAGCSVQHSSGQSWKSRRHRRNQCLPRFSKTKVLKAFFESLSALINAKLRGRNKVALERHVVENLYPLQNSHNTGRCRSH